MENNKFDIKEVLSGIMNLIDKDRFIPDCGGDFFPEECEGNCKWFYQCQDGYNKMKQAKYCRMIIEKLK